jgi:hypothetical protein
MRLVSPRRVSLLTSSAACISVPHDRVPPVSRRRISGDSVFVLRTLDQSRPGGGQAARRRHEANGEAPGARTEPLAGEHHSGNARLATTRPLHRAVLHDRKTSNPSIFDKAIASGAYDDEIDDKATAGSDGETLCFELAIEDLLRAADPARIEDLEARLESLRPEVHNREQDVR